MEGTGLTAAMEPTVTVAAVTAAAPVEEGTAVNNPSNTTPSRVIEKVGQLLVSTKNGLHFPPDAQIKVAVLVEVAARLKDPVKAKRALMDLVRMATALQASRHAAASNTLQTILKGSAAGRQVLAGSRRRESAAFARFQPSHGTKTAQHAPVFDAPSGDGVSLQKLFPNGVSRRLEPSPKRPLPRSSH